MNVDEILRIPSNKLLVNLRGNKPLLLDKMIYTEHELSKKLENSSIIDYNPMWQKHINKKIDTKEPEKIEEKKKVIIDESEIWNIF